MAAWVHKAKSPVSVTPTLPVLEIQMPAYLGIDLAKHTFQCTLLLADTRKRHTFPNTPTGFTQLWVWLAKQTMEPLQACMEATNTYWEGLATFLYDQGCPVSVVNPKRIRDFAKSMLQRNKTDKLDGDVIAAFCAALHPEPWSPLPQEVRELRELVRHLADLQVLRNQEGNRLSEGQPSETVRQMLEAHLTFLDQQIAELEQRIQTHIEQHPDLKAKRELLTSIKSIGPLTAARLLAENIQAFTHTRELVAFYGLNPQKGESGSSVHRKEKLSKIGRSSLRQALYFPAMNALRFNPLVKAFCDQLRARGKLKMVVLGAAMRKLLCLALGVLKSGKPFDPQYVGTVPVRA
jgi:transposase